jgi:ATP-dependent RNA helicase HrpB
MIPLPIDSVIPQLLAAVRAARAAVLVAPPGAGKTTRVPPALLAANLLAEQHPRLVMLQPRRVAARAAAVRIAEENHWELGRQVGYQVRFERVLTPQTPLRVVTEAILTNQILDDPFLESVGAVVLDEFHERSLQTDLAIALLREIRRTVRPDLMVLVMSATLDAEPVAAFLDACPVVRTPGRLFDVEIEYRPPSGLPLEQRAAEEVRNVLAQDASESGDVLVFLPGSREIRRTQAQLAGVEDLVLPLHGSLPFEQQVQALRPGRGRKVILATNIAQTSLTIPGVRTVIDGGWMRQAEFDPRRGLDRLHLTRISRASARQRAGRAGRIAPGRCIKLYTAKDEAAWNEFDAPEIQRVDLSAAALALHAWGKPPQEFEFFQPPPPSSLQAAQRLLEMLGALSHQTPPRITSLGRRMLKLPVHPRLGRMLIAAAAGGLGSQAAALAALLSERQTPSLQSPPSTQSSSDLLVRLAQPLHHQAARLQRDLQRMIRGIEAEAKANAPAQEAALLKLILLAYPDRVCRRRAGEPRRAVMVGGGGALLDRQSVVHQAEFFVAVDVRQEDRIANRQALVRWASAIDPAWLEECFPGSVTRQTVAQFDPRRGKVMGLTQIRYLDLILSQQPDTAVAADEAAAVLAAALLPQAAEIFAADESSAGLLARIEFLRRWMPEHSWPVFDADALAQALEAACQGKRSVEELKRQPLAPFLARRLAHPLDRLLDQQAPLTIQLPSGKPIRIQYEPGRPPLLAARLADLFGWKTAPRLAGGRAALRLEILGPNHRPVQVTDDLENFWKTTYFQVRKDLRRRYPKHPWPLDPLTAPPLRRR